MVQPIIYSRSLEFSSLVVFLVVNFRKNSQQKKTLNVTIYGITGCTQLHWIFILFWFKYSNIN